MPRQLLDLARTMRDAGELPSGRKISGHADFFLGAADSPIDPPADWTPKGLEAKIAAGAQFVQTQFCMDAGTIRRYAERSPNMASLQKLHFLIGIAPLRSGKSARWIKDKLFGAIVPDALIERMDAAADPVAEGSAICARTDRGDCLDQGHCRRPHHGAEQRCSGAGRSSRTRANASRG